MKNKYTTREEWLHAAIKLSAPLFAGHNYKIPQLHVACGWPHKGGTSKKKRTLGQCWAPEASADKLHQIFISPYLENKEDDGVLPTLVHEVVHAVVGLEARHGKIFRKCATALGLEGKMTSTYAGDDLMAKIELWQKSLGVYPHAKLDPQKSGTPKQTTRMIKMECGDCGCVYRTARKWLDAYGAPECPGGHGKMSIEKKD